MSRGIETSKIKSMNKKEKFGSFKPEKETAEEAFQHYVEDLRLTPEDFDKKILDVGAGSAQFAKWAKEHHVSSQIYSAEPQTERLTEKEKSVSARAENLPFPDETFDLVISVAAIPNIYLGEDPKVMKEKIVQGFNEMTRVVKTGGEIRLARVLIGNIYEPQRILSESIDEALQKIEEGGAQVEKIRTPSDDTYEYEGHKRKRLLAEAYLLIIHKPFSHGVVNK